MVVTSERSALQVLSEVFRRFLISLSYHIWEQLTLELGGCIVPFEVVECRWGASLDASCVLMLSIRSVLPSYQEGVQPKSLHAQAVKKASKRRRSCTRPSARLRKGQMQLRAAPCPKMPPQQKLLQLWAPTK